MKIELAAFFVTSFFLVISPGPSVVYIVAYSLRYGATAGVISALGANVGSYGLILISAFSLSELISRYPNLISFVQVVGGFYIIYLATRLWPRASLVRIDQQVLTRFNYFELFKNGFLTSIFNPKDILFYTAFIPLFLTLDLVGSSYQSSFLILAFSHAFMGLLTKCIFALFSGKVKNLLSSGNEIYLNYTSSMILFFLGVFLVGQHMFTWLF